MCLAISEFIKSICPLRIESGLEGDKTKIPSLRPNKICRTHVVGTSCAILVRTCPNSVPAARRKGQSTWCDKWVGEWVGSYSTKPSQVPCLLSLPTLLQYLPFHHSHLCELLFCIVLPGLEFPRDSTSYN